MVSGMKKHKKAAMNGDILLLGFFFCSLIIWPSVSLARLVPSALLKWPDRGAEYAILVDKSSQKLYVYHRDDLSKPKKSFRCSTGENKGPKTRRNDRKTPEGVYFFTKAYVSRELAPIYGSKAFPIDYPNPLDRNMGKGGYGIWFHGTNEPLKPRDSNGCIVLENGHIEDLGKYINLRETPAIITERIEWVQKEGVMKESRNLIGIIEGWRKTWEGKEIDRYMKFYSPQFAIRGMDWHRWKAYKTRIAKNSGRIKIGVHNLRLFKTNGVVLAMFDQTYETPAFESRGRKRLYLSKNSNQWKIIGEFFEKYKPSTRPTRKPDRVLSDLRGLVEAWKTAWESKDLNTYMGFYANEFRARGMDWKAWKSHKAKLNRKYRLLKIDISGLRIAKISKTRAEIKFRQHYKADTYEDIGIKKLLLVKRGRQWKIRGETWDLITAGSAL